jgi:RimJ/RimL family protein N-acetyltransferase
VASQFPRAAPLSTARLQLEPLRPGHAAEMVDVLADPDLYRFTGGVPPTAAELADRYARQARGVSPDGCEAWLNWMLRAGTAGLVGTVQATVRGEGPLEAELAWVLAPAHQGRGLATEAAGAAMARLRREGVAAFSAYIAPAHAASAAVAGRLGFARSGQHRDGEERWTRLERFGRPVEVVPMDDADAAELAGWHYPGELAFYDMESDPDDLAELLDPVRRAGRYFAVRQDDELVGFYCLIPRAEDVELGLGLRPDLIGRGDGAAFVRAGVAFARAAAVTLRVAVFNERARRVYARVGFAAVETTLQPSSGTLVEMTRMRL